MGGRRVQGFCSVVCARASGFKVGFSCFSDSVGPFCLLWAMLSGWVRMTAHTRLHTWDLHEASELGIQRYQVAAILNSSRGARETDRAESTAAVRQRCLQQVGTGKPEMSALDPEAPKVLGVGTSAPNPKRPPCTRSAPKTSKPRINPPHPPGFEPESL